MTLKEQVCSLELSKKLKSLGVKQESLFYWVKHWNLNAYGWGLFQEDKDDNVNEHTSAFTVAELGEMLPTRSSSWRQLNGLWVADYYWEFSSKNLTTDKFQMDTEANARAKMLIYLIENNLINPKEKK